MGIGAQELDAKLKVIRDASSYSGGSAADTAQREIRKAFMELRVEADERDTLRQLLVEKGVANAQLTAEIAEVQVALQIANGRASDVRFVPFSRADLEQSVIQL